MVHRVAIGLGSNLGDRLSMLRIGIAGLRRCLEEICISRVYETEPLHIPEQPPFLNACCTGRTRLTPRQLLSELKDIERRAGRGAGRRFGPRELDLDLLLYGTKVVDRPGLAVPHPRLRDRAFVLVPLRDIAADWRVPGDATHGARTVKQLAEVAGSDGVERTDLQLGDQGSC